MGDYRYITSDIHLNARFKPYKSDDPVIDSIKESLRYIEATMTFINRTRLIMEAWNHGEIMKVEVRPEVLLWKQ